MCPQRSALLATAAAGASGGVRAPSCSSHCSTCTPSLISIRCNGLGAFLVRLCGAARGVTGVCCFVCRAAAFASELRRIASTCAPTEDGVRRLLVGVCGANSTAWWGARVRCPQPRWKSAAAAAAAAATAAACVAVTAAAASIMQQQLLLPLRCDDHARGDCLARTHSWHPRCARAGTRPTTRAH